MNFQLTLALRYLWGRKLRSTLTTLSIVFGVMVTFGLNGMLPAVADSFRQNLMASTNQVDLTITSAARGVFDAGALDVVGDTPGVAHATGSLVRTVVWPTEQAPRAKDGQPLNSVLLNGLDPATVSAVRPPTLLEGRALQVGDGDVVLISESLAATTGLGLGDRLRLPSASGADDFEIVGVVATRPTAGVEDIYAPLSVAQALLNLPGQINTIEALLAPGSDVDAARQAALTALGNGYKLGGHELGSDLLASLEMADVVFILFGVMALAMGGFIIFNTFRTIVVERQRDVGMLRSVGATRRTIVGLILTESLLQGVVGTAIGMVAGYLFVVGMLALVAPVWQGRLHFSLGDPSFSLRTYVLSIGLGVGVTLVAGLYPARAASRVTPLEALRPSMGKVTWRSTGKRVAWGAGLVALALLGLFSGHVGLISLGSVLFLVGLVLVGPALVHPISEVFGRMLALVFAREGHLAQGNLVRQPGRAAVTASAMMIGLAIVLALTGLVTTLTSGILGYVDTSLGADYLVMPQSVVLGGGNVGAGPQLAQALRDTPGVAVVTTLRVGTSRIAGVDVQMVGVDPVTFQKVSGLQFTAGDPGQAYGELGGGRALIANGLYAAQNGVEVGQELTLQTPEGPQTYRVVGIGIDYLNSKLATVYVSHANLAGDFHERNDTLLMANQTGDADPAAVRAALEDRVQGYPAFTLYAFDEWRQQLRGESNAKLAAMYLLVAVVAVPSLIALTNTLGINVLERTREIGVLRAVGATRRQVRRVILAESLLLSVAGVALGILAGVWLGYVFVAGLNMAGYASEYYFPYAGILLTVAVGLCFGVLAALIPARQAARMNVIAALRYE